ncbi:hypothetical protein B0H14DRAFT_2818919, partial [Mycena olivaceomarginata]
MSTSRNLAYEKRYVPSLISTLGVSAPHTAHDAHMRSISPSFASPPPAPFFLFTVFPPETPDASFSCFSPSPPSPSFSSPPSDAPPHPLHLPQTNPNSHPPMHDPSHMLALPPRTPLRAAPARPPRVPRHPLQRRAQAPVAPLAGASVGVVRVILERAGREAAVLPLRRPDAVSPPQRAPPPSSCS